MWSSLAVAAALSLAPGDAGGLQVSHVRTTHGVRGPARPDNNFLPGDAFTLTFDVEGVTADDGGRVLYSMATEVTDAAGKVQFRQEPRDLEAVIALGGGRLPAYAQVDIGPHQPAGDYKVRVTVTDRATKHGTSFEREFKVLPAGFGLVRLTTTSDADGRMPVAVSGAGEALWINYHVVGFGRAKGQPNLAVELRVVDERGEPTLAKPFTGEIDRDVPAKAHAVPVQFLVTLNRPGKFTVELKATDRATGQSARLTFPLTVAASE